VAVQRRGEQRCFGLYPLSPNRTSLSKTTSRRPWFGVRSIDPECLSRPKALFSGIPFNGSKRPARIRNRMFWNRLQKAKFSDTAPNFQISKFQISKKKKSVQQQPFFVAKEIHREKKEVASESLSVSDAFSVGPTVAERVSAFAGLVEGFCPRFCYSPDRRGDFRLCWACRRLRYDREDTGSGDGPRRYARPLFFCHPSL
jgi:hypothetical protein